MAIGSQAGGKRGVRLNYDPGADDFDEPTPIPDPAILVEESGEEALVRRVATVVEEAGIPRELGSEYGSDPTPLPPPAVTEEEDTGPHPVVISSDTQYGLERLLAEP